MQGHSGNGFVHSERVPRSYKTASRIAQKVTESGGSFKDLVFANKHAVKPIYVLVVETLKRLKLLDKLIAETKLLKNEPRLDPWLTKILLTELLFQQRELKGQSKPIQTVLSYKSKFDKLLQSKTFSNDLTQQLEGVAKPRYVRINTLKLTPDEAIKVFREEGWRLCTYDKTYAAFLQAATQLDAFSFLRDFHLKEVLVFPSSTEFHQHPLYLDGSILLQDKASCLSAHLLSPAHNASVLDMCAAPGMKTTHLSALLRNKGRVLACERHKDRYKTLCDFVVAAGCTNVKTLHADALSLVDDVIDVDDIEFILVDPTCSGSGMTDRIKIFSQEQRNPEKLLKLSQFQHKLLSHALTNFPNVKRVVYSTCSIETKENEDVVRSVLNQVNYCHDKRGRRVYKPRFKMAAPMTETWERRGSAEFDVGRFCLFADPWEDLTNGFFIAVFERLGEGEVWNLEGNEGMGNGDPGFEDGKGKKRKSQRVVNGNDVGEAEMEDEHVGGMKKGKGGMVEDEGEKESKVVNEEIMEETEEKGEKKKKKRVTRNEETENDKVCLDNNAEFEVKDKKKKKNRKHVDNTDIVEEIGSAEKKKHRKNSEENVGLEKTDKKRKDVEQAEIVEKNYVKEAKAKKKELENVEENVDGSKDDRKRKKGREEIELGMEVDEGKKKKKKKEKGGEEMREKSSKDGRKTKSKAAENIEENVDMEVTEGRKKKKKNKVVDDAQ